MGFGFCYIFWCIVLGITGILNLLCVIRAVWGCFRRIGWGVLKVFIIYLYKKGLSFYLFCFTVVLGTLVRISRGD